MERNDREVNLRLTFLYSFTPFQLSPKERKILHNDLHESFWYGGKKKERIIRKRQMVRDIKNAVGAGIKVPVPRQDFSITSAAKIQRTAWGKTLLLQCTFPPELNPILSIRRDTRTQQF